MSRLCTGLVVGALPIFMLGQDIGGTPSRPLREQLATAEIVAFAKILAGNADSLPRLFRAKVTEALKGTKPGDVICFETGDAKIELGTEYLLVLEKTPWAATPSTGEVISEVCRAEKSRPILHANGTTLPLPVRYTYKVRSLCPAQTCPFGVEAVDVWSSGLGPLPNFVEGFEVRDGSARETQFWIRKAQLIYALRWELGAAIDPSR